METAGLVVQMNGASQAKSLSGRPKTDKADAMWLARLTEIGAAAGVLRAAQGGPRRFCVLAGRPEHGGPEPTRRVTMCDWSSRRLGTWLARDTGGSAPEHVAGDDEGT